MTRNERPAAQEGNGKILSDMLIYFFLFMDRAKQITFLSKILDVWRRVLNYIKEGHLSIWVSIETMRITATELLSLHHYFTTTKPTTHYYSTTLHY